MSIDKNIYDETFMYGMDYITKENDQLINNNEHNDNNVASTVGTSETKDVFDEVDNGKVKNKTCYRRENFEQHREFYKKYFCILNASFPKFPCRFANKIYEISTLKRWIYAQQYNDGCLDTDYCRNPTNGVFKMYGKPVSLSSEEISNYLSMLSEYKNCSTSRIKWLKENHTFHMPKRQYAYNV